MHRKATTEESNLLRAAREVGSETESPIQAAECEVPSRAVRVKGNSSPDRTPSVILGSQSL